MKWYLIDAKRFIDNDNNDEVFIAPKPPNGNGQYLVQKFKKNFSIWEDYYGDYGCGEDPKYSHFNLHPWDWEKNCKSLEECKKILIDNDLIEPSSEFKDIEED